MGIGGFVKLVWDEAKEHSHIVLAAGALIGLAGSIILTYKKAPKIHAIMEEQKQKVLDIEERADRQEITEEEVKTERKAVTRETIKRLAPEVAPIAVCGLSTGGLMVGSAVAGEMKIAHVRDLLSISEMYNHDILEKVKENLGEEKAREIKDSIAEDRLKEKIEKDKDWKNGILQAKGGGDTLYWDNYMGRLFLCDKNTIRDVVLGINEKINSGEWYPLNAIYRGLELPTGKAGENIGAGGMYCKIPKFRLYLDHGIALDNGESAVVFDFWDDPVAEDKPY